MQKKISLLSFILLLIGNSCTKDVPAVIDASANYLEEIANSEVFLNFMQADEELRLITEKIDLDALFETINENDYSGEEFDPNNIPAELAHFENLPEFLQRHNVYEDKREALEIEFPNFDKLEESELQVVYRTHFRNHGFAEIPNDLVRQPGTLENRTSCEIAYAAGRARIYIYEQFAEEECEYNYTTPLVYIFCMVSVRREIKTMRAAALAAYKACSGF